MKDTTCEKQWFTTQECVGVPGFPTGVSNVRNKLEKLADGLDGVKRRRGGSKAIEYHVSILPEMSRRFFGIAQISPDKENNSQQPLDDSSKQLWELIYQSMTPAQREAVVDIFMAGGIRLLMPDVVGLSAIDNELRKEILQQRSINENAPPAPSVSTQNKKAG
ncbi:DNA-binding protein [Citrobacter braakii]|uniref:DNA-binding protein n=1 Tax=Citrobacter braakii TaxID=57706 RepID=UPI0040393F62